MAVYLAEPIDINDLQALFEDNWDIKSGGEVPQPEFEVSTAARFDPSLVWATTPRFAFVNISLSPIAEKQAGYAYDCADQEAVVTLDIRTRRENATAGGNGRQYLHDVKRELRRIIYSNKHSLANWQIMEYMEFEEQYDASNDLVGSGKITIRLRNQAIAAGAELVDEDLFNRADAAIGGEWTQDNGTWEVVSNQAALQSATADAIARFTPQTFKINQRATVDIVTVDSMEAGLIFRFVSAGNHWLIRVIETGGVKFIRLVQVVATVETQIMEIREPGWADDDTIQIEVDLYNTGIGILYNGLAIFALESTVHQAGLGYGLYSNSDQLTRFDNFGIFESGGDGR